MNAILPYICALLKNIIYGLSVYFTGKLSENVDILDILALRFLLTFSVFYILKLFGILKINIGIKDLTEKTEKSKYFKYLFLTGLFEPVLYMLFETMGISMTSNITAGVIFALSPIFYMLAEEIVLKEKSSLLQKIFFLIGICGVIYIVLNTDTADGKDSFAGIMFIVLAVSAGALFATFSRKSSRYFSPMERTYFASWLGMVCFNAVNILRHIYMHDLSEYFIPYLNIDNIIGFIYLSVISTIVATGMNNYALGKVKTSTISAFSGMQTLTTITAGIFLNGEILKRFQVLGIILILIEIIGVSVISSINNDNVPKS